MLLVQIALVFALGAPGVPPAPAPSASPPKSQLPATLPGLGKDEGVFLVTTAADGRQVVYFIAENKRHSIQTSDLQVEQQLNALWPVRWAPADDILAYAEAAPIGTAKPDLLTRSAPAPADEVAPTAEAPAAEPAADTAPTQAAAQPVAPSASAPSSPRAVAMPTAAADSAPRAVVPSAGAALSVEPMGGGLSVEPLAGIGEPTPYVLKPGDNLTRLSEQFSTTVEAILTTNNLADANRIFVGQSLVMPVGDAGSRVDAPTEPAPVAETPSESGVANAPEDTSTVASADEQTYTVRPGDSAFKIAMRFGVDQAALLEANGIVNANRVYIGQSLVIPGA